MAEHPPASGPLVLELPVTKVRRGHQLRLVIPGPSKAPSFRRDEKLVMLIAEPHAARTLLSSTPGRSIAAIAASAGKCRSEAPTSELQSLMRISYAVFFLKKKNITHKT